MNTLFAAIALVALPAQAATQPPAEQAKTALKVQEQLADLAILQSLTVLKWTPEQLTKLIPILQKARKSAVDLNTQDDADLVRFAAETAKVRAAAITGESVPPEFEKKINEMRRVAAARRAAAVRKTTGETLSDLREILTESQKTEMEHLSETFYGGKRVPKEFAKKPADAPKEVVQDLAITAYIENVLLFDRTLTLLEAMKAAAAPKTP